MKFSELIKHLRETQLMSQEAFAKEIGVSFTTINRWENGKATPTYRTKQMINNYCVKSHIDIDLNKDIQWND